MNDGWRSGKTSTISLDHYSTYPMSAPERRTRRLAAQLKAQPTAATLDTDPFPSPSPGQLIVYGIPTSRVVKALWIAEECKQHIELVRLFKERNFPWALALNPKGTVPFFKDGDLVLNESNTILAYIAQKYGGSPLYPSSPETLALAWNWLEWGETTLAPAQVCLFFGKVRKTYHPGWQKKKGAPTHEELGPFVDDLVAAYKHLNAHFSDGRSFMLGNDFTIADMTPAIHAQRCFLNGGFGFAALSPSDFPHVVAWLDRLGERPAYAKLVNPN
jgi:glutathione S-transferase